ncbi:hypothetical protein [Ruegeria meonggei]|uniref:Uncharacterized protein n=1 Tax=Ruegeria meonggei TaxID=1446476 RepID=A0A1X6ZWU0_9RHOB|nr:hypothetical protein RUM8411_03184 [Ruegeria meonggei]
MSAIFVFVIMCMASVFFFEPMKLVLRQAFDAAVLFILVTTLIALHWQKLDHAAISAVQPAQKLKASEQVWRYEAAALAFWRDFMRISKTPPWCRSHATARVSYRGS